MSATQGALDALLVHLDREARRLTALETLLEREAAALRRLDALALEACAAEKAALASDEPAMAAERRARIAALAPVETLEALRAHVADPRLAAAHDGLRTQAERVLRLHRRNVEFTESARAVVAGALRSAAQARTGKGATYGADAQLRAPERG
jgi:hypothetical protein